MEKDIFPWVGARLISDVTPFELLAALRRIENRGAIDTAHRAHQNCGQIFRYAIATGRAERDSSADLRGALPPVRKKHLASIVKPEDIGILLQNLKNYQGHFVTKCALRIMPIYCCKF